MQIHECLFAEDFTVEITSDPTAKPWPGRAQPHLAQDVFEVPPADFLVILSHLKKAVLRNLKLN
jgi:hypothetical protein